MRTIKCPHCNGRGALTTILARGTRTARIVFGEIACPRCNGTSVVRQVPVATEEQKAAFLVDLQALYMKHNLALGHEDTEGGFILERLNTRMVDWVTALDIGEEDEEENG